MLFNLVMALRAQTLDQKRHGYLIFEFLEGHEVVNLIVDVPGDVPDDLERIPVLENENMCSFCLRVQI